jgi:hypothetical protein
LDLMQILINHIGYEPDQPKKAIVQDTHPITATSFRLVCPKDNATRYIGNVENQGNVPGWKDRWFGVLEFSDFTKTGIFFLEIKSDQEPVQESIQSAPLEIRNNLIQEEALALILDYFYGQHPSDRYEQKDRAVPFTGEVRDDTVDVRGGWCDASGDVSKYLSHLSYTNFMNPQQIPLAVWHIARLSQLDIPPRLKEKAVNEVLHGADFLCRMQDRDGYFYMTVF